MAKNYQDWDIDSLKEEHKKYQRMLIPANIVAIIIAIVAIIGQLFMPMLSVDVTVTGDNFSAVLEYIQDNGEGAAEDDETLQMLEYVSKDVYTKVELNVDPLGALMLGVTPQPQEVRDYIASNADKLEETVDGMLAQMMPRMTVYMVAQATQDQLEDAGINFEELESVDLEQVEAVTESLSSGNYEQAKEQFGTAADSVAEELGYDLTAEDKETIMGYFDEAVEAGKKDDGTFSFTQAIETLAEKYGFNLDDLNPDNLPEDIPSVTPSSALGRVNVAASDTSSPEGEGSSGSSLDLNEMLQNYIAEIPDEQASVIGTALFAVAAATIGLTSLMWAIMAVFALIKLFCSNKRFTMWYVKLLCWLPCVLFVLAPFFALTLAPQLLAGTVTGEAAEILTLATQIPMSFGGSGIVSGICLAVLWLISIFWFFPIKHKIRKIKNSMDN